MDMRSIFFIIPVILFCIMCQPQTPKETVKMIDVQGHRGCRGLMPENTLPAFQKALELDVNTLELDLAVSRDKQLVVSHEPFFRSGLSISPSGNPVTKEDQLNHNIYKMSYDTVKMYDVGSLPDPRFPEKENIHTFKPLLSEVIAKAQHYAYTFKKPLVNFNIEIKRNPEYDNLFHPPVEEFVNLVIKEVKELDIYENTTIQSFDAESLRLVKSKEPRLRTAWLTENEKSLDENLVDLGFKPDIYSCYYKRLTMEDVESCHNKDILVIPWTVNTVEDIQAMIDMNVDGIISDYPDRVINLVRKK